VANVVGVVFRRGAKIYHFDAAELELARGERVVVETVGGKELGTVSEASHELPDEEIDLPLKKVLRVATDEDLETEAAAESLRRQALAKCRELIAAHGLDMKLVSADISLDQEKVTFSFSAEERVDFRALVADLAKSLKMRIELRQVGVREEARIVGGLGPCGRNLCCTLFTGGDDPVSIRMAKEQNLPLNPVKISGLCGRLMCCLKYEQEQYVRFRKEAPPKGTPVSTPAGEGVIVGYNVPRDAIVVRFEDGSFTNVRLSGCQCREDGCLMVLPEAEEETPFVPPVESAAERANLAIVAAEPEALAVVEAEVITGENGEPVEVIVAEGSRPTRRSRGRRGRRRRKPGEGDHADGQAKSTTPGGAVADGQTGRENRRPGDGPSARSGSVTGSDQSAGEQDATKRTSRRRRRRPRRSSGAGSEGGGNGGPTGGQSGGSGGGGDAGGSSAE